MDIKVIINPEAGIRKRTINSIERKIAKRPKTPEQIIADVLLKKGFKAKIKVTKHKRDIRKLIISAKEKIIVIAGGDGTINEAINSLKDFRKKIGIIPLGSENGFAKEAGIPLSIEKACEAIIKGKTRKVDLGEINGRKFAFVAGIGFDAQAVTRANKSIKKIIGQHVYALSAITTLFEHDPPELDIKINKEKHEKGCFAIITNSKTYGGSIKVAGKAKLDDGWLWLNIFRKKDASAVIKYILGAAKRDITHIREIKRYRIKTAEITAKGKVLHQTDGEISGTTPAKIKVLPRKLNLIVP